MRAVKRLSKAILFTLAGLAALTVVALIVLNLYLQSPGTQAQIQEAISDALGMPIEITNTSLTPWSDLKINGIRIPAQDGAPGNFIEAQSFTAHYRVFPLFRRKLIVPHMTLDGPKVVWRETADGRWVWPKMGKAREEKEPSKPKIKKEKQLEGESRTGFQVVIEGLGVQQGSIEMIDSKGVPVLTATDVSIEFTKLMPVDVAGTLRVAKVTWASAVSVDQLAAPFTFNKGTFDLSGLTAQLAEGTVNGNFHLETESPGAQMAFNLSLGQVSLGTLSTSAGWAEAGALTGAISGDVEMRGSSKEFTRGQGKGRLRLENGHFRQLELFQAIGQVLAIDELTNLQLSEASGEFRIADEKAFIESIILATPDLRVTANGVARMDNKLSLDARLAITDNLAKRLPESVRKSFAEPGADGIRSLDFKIGGKVLKPKTDIAEKLVGNIIGGEVQDLISGLFGNKKKKPDDKEAERKKVEKKPEKPGSAAPSVEPSKPVNESMSLVPPVPSPQP